MSADVARQLRRLWWLLAPAATLFAFRSVTTYGFLGDARFLVLENHFVQDLGYLWDNVVHDYFWSSSGAVIPYWRPLTKASWVLEHPFFRDWAGGYLLVQLGWHVLGVLGVQFFARSLGLERRWALLAGLLYGLSPVAIEPVSLLMARSCGPFAAGIPTRSGCSRGCCSRSRPSCSRRASRFRG